MKYIITSLFIAVLAGTAISQTAERSANDTEEVFRSRSVGLDDRDLNMGRQETESARVLNELMRTIRVRDNSPNKPVVYKEADFQWIVFRAEEFFARRQYDDAIRMYTEALTFKSDQQSADRILEARALSARQNKELEAQRQDQLLRAKAEFAAVHSGSKPLVHFTGGVLSDKSSDVGVTKIFAHDDNLSDYLGAGRYDTVFRYIPHARNQTLDGMAIPADVRVIIYSSYNCTGDVLLDITGPAIINNSLWINDPRYNEANTKTYTEDLQPFFPQATRSWSTTNMHDWSYGSMVIRVL